MLDMNTDYFVGYNHNREVIIINRDNNTNFTANIHPSKIVLNFNIIYYIDEYDSLLYAFDIDNNTSKLLINKQIEIGLSSDNNYLFYTLKEESPATTGSKIYRYNIETEEDILFYEGKYCFFYMCSGNKLYMEDYT